MGYLGTKPGNQIATSEQIPDSAITTAKVADGAVTPAKLSTGAPTWSSSGNLGLGVTPSAWASNWKVLELPYGSFRGNAGGIGIGGNVYNNTSNVATYKANGRASSYDTYDGGHYWYTAPSGTAGNSISFTQAMTLDASGNLGVGTTSPSNKLDVKGVLGIQRSTNSETSTLTMEAGNFDIKASPFGYPITFFTGTGGSSSERARIDTSGNLLVGTTSTISASVKGIQVDSVDWATTFRTSGAGGNGLPAFMQRTASTGGLIAFQYGAGVGTAVGSITTNGTTTAYNTSSDYRLKENVQPMTGALARVASLKPCTYTWIADGSDGEGFIAHELQAVVPDAVFGEKDAVNEDGSIKPQGIDTSFLVATLTAAIQEQQAIITQLQADVELLKGQS